MYVKDSSIQTCTNELNQALISVSQWLSNSGHEISYDKTSAIFTRSYVEFPSSITLNQIEIKHCTSNRFLGVYVDSRLTWKRHICEIVDRSAKSMNILRMISSQRWGADPSISLLFYRACVRSLIDYGCLVYGNASISLLKKLDVIHNKCIRLCVGLLNDTPINALLSEAGEIPLFIRRQKLGIAFILNCYRKSSPIIGRIQKLFILDMTAKYWILKNSPMLVTCYYLIKEDGMKFLRPSKKIYFT